MKIFEGCAKFRSGGRALHGGRINEDLHGAMAAFEDVENVLEDGAGGRGDDADARGEGGEREFAGGVEEAFELEAVAKFFEGEAEAPSPTGSSESAMSCI